MNGGKCWQHLAIKDLVLTSPQTWLVINGHGAKALINMDELLSTEKRWYTLTISLTHHKSCCFLLRFFTHIYYLTALTYMCSQSHITTQWMSHTAEHVGLIILQGQRSLANVTMCVSRERDGSVSLRTIWGAATSIWCRLNFQRPLTSFLLHNERQ